MSSRRGIEENVVEGHVFLIAGQQLGEFVERRDLDGASAGKLLAELGQLCCGPRLAIRRDHALAVGVGCFFGVDVERPQPVDPRDRQGMIRKRDAEHLVEVRCRVGADQQDSLAAISESYCGCARKGRLADSTLAGEEEIPARLCQEGACSVTSFGTVGNQRHRPGTVHGFEEVGGEPAG